MLRPPPLGAGVSTEAARTIAASGSPCSGFRVSGFGFRVSGSGYGAWDSASVSLGLQVEESSHTWSASALLRAEAPRPVDSACAAKRDLICSHRYFVNLVSIKITAHLL